MEPMGFIIFSIIPAILPQHSHSENTDRGLSHSFFLSLSLSLSLYLSICPPPRACIPLSANFSRLILRNSPSGWYSGKIGYTNTCRDYTRTYSMLLGVPRSPLALHDPVGVLRTRVSLCTSLLRLFLFPLSIYFFFPKSQSLV